MYKETNMKAIERRTQFGSLIWLLLLLGCHNKVVHGDHEADWIRLPTSTNTAPWLESDTQQYTPGQLAPARTIAHGVHTALVDVGLGILAIDPEKGVTHWLELPEERAWIGLGTQDSLLVAMPDGSLLRSRLDQAVSRDDMVTHVTDAEVWDSAPGLIAAATQTGALWISRDDGQRFNRVETPWNQSLSAIYTRHDGVIVARADNELHISTDFGQTWRRSWYAPKRLIRKGAWIAGVGRCSLVLSRDGHSWVQIRDDAVIAALRSPSEESWGFQARIVDRVATSGSRPSFLARVPEPPPAMWKRS